jgi:hypothetical protein
MFSKFTENMQAMLPQWMKMAKDPNSVGAQFLNVFGLEFDDVREYLDQTLNNQYIDTASIGQIDIIYKVPLALPIVLDMEELDSVSATKDGIQYFFRLSESLRVFYAEDEYENKAILDRESGVVYLKPVGSLMEGELLLTPFDSVEINGAAHYEYSLHHVWNAFDEFGLLLGVERLYGERNESFKQRILDVFRKPGNATKGGLTNALSRELGLEESEVTINEFANKAFRGSLLNELDGSPTQKLLGYVDRINKVFGFTWDNMTWGDAYWRSIEETQMGLEYLPHVWDASTAGWLDTDFQSGIGDGDDLKVIAPKEESNIRNFKYYVGLRGRNSGLERIDPEINFKYKITAKGMILDEEYRPEEYKYTVVSSEIVLLHYRLRAMKTYFYQTRIQFDTTTETGYEFDDATNPSIEIIDGTTNLSKTNSEYKYYKISAELSTRSKQATPQVHTIGVKWRDTAGVLRDYVLDTQVDLTRNDVDLVDTEMSDILVSELGDIELGFGDFYSMIDTEGSFKEGTHTRTVEITRVGSLKLNLPNQ